jgi:two-component system, cell cycle response regulator
MSQTNDPLEVLVADDEWVSRELVAQALAQSGYRVARARDGRQAWEALAQGAYSLAVLDWTMPGMDGVTICRALRQQAQEGHVYIILVTGRGDPTDLVAGLDAGADDYLLKPFLVEELKARVRVGERMVRMQQQAKEASQQLLALALKDEVTGLPSRRAILERLEEAYQRRARDGRPLSILLADLDDFKRVNDDHGHGAGDRALREFARRICVAVRPYDVTGRLGGDEFLAILPDATESQAAAVGERVRSAVLETAFDLGPAGPHRLTASWGIGQVEDGLSLEEALCRADQALYEAKASGGNRVCTPPTPGPARSAHRVAPTRGRPRALGRYYR